MVAFIIVIAVILILFFAGAVYMSRYVSCPQTELEASKKWEYDHNFWRDFDKRKLVEYEITSFDGHVIPTVYVENPDHPKDIVIISHGYCSSRYGALKYLNKWMELGFSCIIFDQRYHGASVRKIKECCTLGVKESRDLVAIIEDSYRRFGEDIYLGLQGESMGSATQITALKYKPRVHFLVNDCGFAEMFGVLKVGITGSFHLPSFLLYPISAVNRIFFGWSFIKNRPIDSLKDNTVPVCFIHGGKDDFIVPENSFRMKEANPAYSEIHIFDNAEHAASMYLNEPAYGEVMKAFVEKVKQIEAGNK